MRGFREVPYMGVIWVVHQAMQRGFWNGNPDWCNLGQGQPEIGNMPGAPDRIRSVTIEPEDQAYGTNPSKADNNGDIDDDGYTNLENYLHWAARPR